MSFTIAAHAAAQAYGYPLLIKQIYGGFEGAPDPLAWAFWGPLVGSAARVVAGPLSDVELPESPSVPLPPPANA